MDYKKVYVGVVTMLAVITVILAVMLISYKATIRTEIKYSPYVYNGELCFEKYEVEIDAFGNEISQVKVFD